MSEEKLTKTTTVDYTKSSQATYYFDCGNGVKGSFCCILKKGTEYFILTAGHNVNSTTNNYKLIQDTENFVVLSLIKDYRNDGYDAAILKINKITENGVKVYDITDSSNQNDDINKSKDFYINAVKPTRLIKFPEDENNLDIKGYLVGIPINDPKNTVSKITINRASIGDDKFIISIVNETTCKLPQKEYTLKIVKN